MPGCVKVHSFSSQSSLSLKASASVDHEIPCHLTENINIVTGLKAQQFQVWLSESPTTQAIL